MFVEDFCPRGYGGGPCLHLFFIFGLSVVPMSLRIVAGIGTEGSGAMCMLVL